MIALVLAQVLQTPSPIVTATPLRMTEAAVISAGIERAQAQMQAHDVTFNVYVDDLTTGATASRAADDRSAAPGGAQIAIALLQARARDAGIDVDATIDALGGPSVVNADLRSLGFDGITVNGDHDATAQASALAALLARSQSGDALSSEAKKRFSSTFTGDRRIEELGAGFKDDRGHHFVVVALTGSDASVEERERAITMVLRAVDDAAEQFPL